MMNRFIQLLALGFFLFILYIIYLANTQGDSIFLEWIKANKGLDKLGHFLLFGTLTLLLNYAFNFKKVNVINRKILLGSLVVIVFVLVEELSQAFIPRRTLDFRDLLADTAGIYLFSRMSSKTDNQ